MQEPYTSDWKDVANTYFDKCIALIILFLMFFIIVYPKVEGKAMRTVDRSVVVEFWEPDPLDRIEQPPEVIRPIINIEIVDDTDDMDDDEILTVSTIIPTTVLPDIVETQTGRGDTPRFVAFEVAPQILQRIHPNYPDFAKRLGIQGTVVLDVEILIDGTIGAIEVFQSLNSGPGGLDEAAIEAVRQWQYRPATNGGNPVACWIKQPILFSIN